MGKIFELDEEEWAKAKLWMQEVDPPPSPGEMPKHGSIGGAFTFTFTNTSIGQIKKVVFLKGTDHEQVLDLSDYESC